MERKIERLTSEEEDVKILKEQLWEQLKTSGYGVREKEKKKRKGRRREERKKMVRNNKYRTIYRKNKGHIKKVRLQHI